MLSPKSVSGPSSAANGITVGLLIAGASGPNRPSEAQALGPLFFASRPISVSGLQCCTLSVRGLAICPDAGAAVQHGSTRLSHATAGLASRPQREGARRRAGGAAL